MSKVVIDTNYFLYALDKDSSYHSKVVALLSDPEIELYTTSKNISEYFAVTTKLRIAPKEVWRFYKEVKQNITILYPNDKSITRLYMIWKWSLLHFQQG